jgi:SAM-dependent methyltransferase
VQAGGFGLVFSAQAWHWVRPEVRYHQAARALRPGGTLALLWHRTRWQDGPLRDGIAELYRRLVPDLYRQRPGFPGLCTRVDDGQAGAEFRGSGCSAALPCARTRGQRPSPPTRTLIFC